MKYVPVIAATIITAVIALPAYATVTNSSSGQVQSDPGQPNSIVIDNFNGTIAPGVTLSAYSLPPYTTCSPSSPTCNARIGTAAQLNDPAPPAGTPANQQFLAVSQGNGVGFAVIDFSAQPLNSVSFYWGSIDNWNTVQLLTPQGNTIMKNGVQDPNSVVTGTSLVAAACGANPTACGSSDIYFDHAGSQRITFNWDPATDPVGEIQFIDSPIPAFELANVTGTLARSAVPEPTSWSLLLAAAAGLTAVSLGRNQRRRA